MSTHPDDWTRNQRGLLQNQYAYLNGDGGFDVVQGVPLIDAASLLGRKRQGDRFSRKEINEIVRRLQIVLWRRRNEFYPGRSFHSPIEILNPVPVLAAIGYSVHEHDSLGEYHGPDGAFEVAGILDKPSKTAKVSKRFSLSQRNFTMAHELGHAVLHGDIRMHRDRPFDGAPAAQRRDIVESEADQFAALFLLPEKVVLVAVEKRFLVRKIHINEWTAFAFGANGTASLLGKYPSRRELSRMIATANFYNGKHFRSLTDQFGVSAEVMAIRLEELNVI